MKKMILLALGFAAAASGCSYAGASALGSDKVVIARDGTFFGVGRGMYVCKVSDKGVSHCMDNESP